MKKLIYIGAAALLTFAAAGAATSHKAKITLVYEPQSNGDYRIFLFGEDRTLVCEEKNITVVSQGDAVNPLVLECKH